MLTMAQCYESHLIVLEHLLWCYWLWCIIILSSQLDFIDCHGHRIFAILHCWLLLMKSNHIWLTSCFFQSSWWLWCTVLHIGSFLRSELLLIVTGRSGDKFFFLNIVFCYATLFCPLFYCWIILTIYPKFHHRLYYNIQVS